MGARAPAQRLTPNVRTGCISCVSGDGADGGPVWWNTPITEAIQRKVDGEGSKNAKGKRPAEDEIDPEVRKRLAALKGELAEEAKAGAGDAGGD
jgi:bud site selection protein 31